MQRKAKKIMAERDWSWLKGGVCDWKGEPPADQYTKPEKLVGVKERKLSRDRNWEWVNQNKGNPFKRNHQFPYAGCLTDCNRCMIAVDSPREILDLKHRFEAADGKTDRYGKGKFSMVRVNNSFSPEAGGPFRCMILNVKLAMEDFEIIGEIQITTAAYLELKKVQHKLYDLKRLLDNKEFSDQKVREQVHKSIMENVCG